MTLNAQAYNQDKLSQQWYLGNYGAIFSAKCRGGVISMEGSCDDGEKSLKLRVYENKESMKWEYKSNGVLRSAKCHEQDYVVSIADEVEAGNGLTSKPMPPGYRLGWTRENTRLLPAQSSGTSWNQEWIIDFVDKDYNGTSLVGELLG